jgi:hypothetical protein
MSGLALALVFAAALSIASDAHSSSASVRANGRIAFAAAGGIAAMNPDGSGQWGVELNVGDTSPAWSPDGTQGPTADLERLSFAPKRPWKGIRYMRVVVPTAQAVQIEHTAALPIR